MPRRTRAGQAIHVVLNLMDKALLDKLTEETGATQAHIIGEALRLYERDRKSHEVYELYAEPLKKIVRSEQIDANKKMHNTIYGGLNEIVKKRVRTVQEYEIANSIMLARILKSLDEKHANLSEQQIITMYLGSAKSVAEENEKNYWSKGEKEEAE